MAEVLSPYCWRFKSSRLESPLSSSGVVYLTTPPFTLQTYNVDGKMSDEWEGIWNEDVVAYSRYYPGIFVA